MSLLPVSEAQDRLLHKARPIERVEDIGLGNAAGRILAVDVIAKLTQPPFHASAMDGYALRAIDAPQPGAVLKVIGESAAGRPFSGTVGPGETVRIFTGAPVPEGADAVLLQEDAERLDGGSIRTAFAISPGRHVRPRGQDFTHGETLVHGGALIDFSRLTLIAAGNHPKVKVYRKPLVAVIATGDELLPPGSELGPGQIIASNTFGIAALARECGAEVLDLGIVADDRPAIAARIQQAVEAGADVLVTLGGASVGDHDLVQQTLVESGMELDFWRIAMRPGKPLMVGSLGAMQVLGLPGNPVSSMVCGLLFMEPLLCRLAHRPRPEREIDAFAAEALSANDKRQDYVRAKLHRSDDGRRLMAEAYGKQDSSMMNIFAHSDGLIIRPAMAPPLDQGEPCRVMLLRPPAF